MVGKMRWGDSAELDDDGDFEVALPAAQVRAPATTERRHALPRPRFARVKASIRPARPRATDPPRSPSCSTCAGDRSRRERREDDHRVQAEGRRLQGSRSPVARPVQP